MADLKQTITSTEETGVNASGVPAQQQTRRIQTETKPDTKTTVQNVVWYILGFIEVLLGIRFLLKLLGANAASSFVSFIYSITKILTAPFDSIFGVTTAKAGQSRSVFEPSILVAALVYALIAWGVVKLITINQKN